MSKILIPYVVVNKLAIAGASNADISGTPTLKATPHQMPSSIVTITRQRLITGPEI